MNVQLREKERRISELILKVDTQQVSCRYNVNVDTVLMLILC